MVGCLEQTDYATFGFAEALMEPCHLAKMITKYVVLNESHKVLMVLRPYQYYATEAIIERVKTLKKFGYIWHTTGSWKTMQYKLKRWQLWKK